MSASNPVSELVFGGFLATALLPSSASRSALRAAFGDGRDRRRCVAMISGIGDPRLLSNPRKVAR
jgi:hypothetical protein